jgi:DNA-binding NtrC family response regulator
MDMLINVLVVDDEEAFAQALAERLEMRELKAEAVFSGEDALTRLQKLGTGIDVVILDVLMPGMGGVEALREIKKGWPLIEVIMLTGNATVETAIEGMKLGAFDYLMKPYEIEELMEKLEKAYRRKKEQEDRIQQAEIKTIIKRRGW